MPHLIMQYSENIVEKINFSDLFTRCHVLLADMLPTDISTCNSRAIRFSNYLIGCGEVDNAFIFVNIKILPGREMENLENISKKVLDIFKEYFYQSIEKLNLQLSIEITELETYCKLS